MEGTALIIESSAPLIIPVLRLAREKTNNLLRRISNDSESVSSYESGSRSKSEWPSGGNKIEAPKNRNKYEEDDETRFPTRHEPIKWPDLKIDGFASFESHGASRVSNGDLSIY